MRQPDASAAARAIRAALAMSGALLLASCGGEEHSDLKQELQQLTKDLRGRVEPLPQVRPYEPVPYKAEGQVDPFRPERINVAQAGGGGAAGGGRKPDLDRPKEPLEAFPLESIQMVGTLSQKKETFALVKAGTNLYRVRRGNYMGQNFGLIVAIDESQVSLKELVQDSGGEWVERTSSLQLQEGNK
jgi:type IV pilus assembly protein PilP